MAINETSHVTGIFSVGNRGLLQGPRKFLATNLLVWWGTVPNRDVICQDLIISEYSDLYSEVKTNNGAQSPSRFKRVSETLYRHL